MWAIRTGAGRYVDKQTGLRFDPVIIYFFEHFGTSQFNNFNYKAALCSNRHCSPLIVSSGRSLEALSDKEMYTITMMCELLEKQVFW